uniref:DUF3615 domain-containing protein n=1 Tax=Oryza barthii TaxID=65489 RepID=A0A0D3HG55_9ORYZ
MAEDANAGRKSSTHSAQSPELHASLESQELLRRNYVSYYADTDEETREQLKQFWDDEFNAISSGETTIERDLKWMRKEVIEAFETYSEANVVDYELEDLSRQCLIFDDCGQPYHHYNFTMKSKRPNSDLESSTNCPDSDLESSHCHGCRNSGIDLKHPSNGGYEEGNADSGFSFDPI